MTRQPDILLLVLDTQRADRLSCYGHALETTPHIDAFAAETTLFRRAIAPAQWTIPSHSSMFTGLYPSAHTTVQSFSKLPATLSTVAERLRSGGYYTAAFCNNPLVGVVNNGLRRGFQSFLNYSGLLTSHPNQAGVRSGLLDRYRQFFKRLLVGVLGRLQDAVARSDALLAFSFTPFVVPIWQTALSFKGNTARALKDAARLLTERQMTTAGQPIFCFINLMGTHMPYHPPRHAVERFAPHVLHDQAARHDLRRFNSDIYGWMAPLTGAIDAERKATIDGMYNAEVFSQDEQVGRFLQLLRSSGALQHTRVIIAADHGDHLGEKHFVGHAFSLYNELVHVPLMVYDPLGDFSRGHVHDEFVSTRRIFHTILSGAGLASPVEERLNLAQHPTADPDGGLVFSEGVPPQNVVNLLQRRQPELVRARHCDQTRRAVCHGEHKLIRTGDDPHHVELYRFSDDPRERRNLQAGAPAEVGRLQAHLQAFVAQVGADAPLATQIAEEELRDPDLQQRLRDLGYIE